MFCCFFTSQADLLEILSEVSRIGQSGEETTLSICGENDILNSSGIQSHCLDFTLRDVSQLKTHKSGHKDGNRSSNLYVFTMLQLGNGVERP